MAVAGFIRQVPTGDELAAPVASPIETFLPNGGFRAVVTIKVKWDERITLMRQALVAPGALYPHAESSGARAVSANSRPFGQQIPHDDNVRFANYNHALVQITYETPEVGAPELIGNDLISEVIEPTAEFLTLDPKGFRWGVVNSENAADTADALTDQEAPGRLERGLDYIITLFDQETIPAQLFDLSGFVNEQELTARSIGRTFLPETLLYKGGTPRRTVSTARGSLAWTITHRFGIRNSGWNRFWRTKTQDYHRIEKGILDSNTDEIVYVPYNNYPLGDFTWL